MLAPCQLALCAMDMEVSFLSVVRHDAAELLKAASTLRCVASFVGPMGLTFDVWLLIMTECMATRQRACARSLSVANSPGLSAL
mmetsp:Transcript_64702/g.127884  ORF Transcript_64702/g.127884 Transcript_64702/m.127884 type:complete len:84 (-) Transcript_64702:1837-2088(-)